MGHSFCLQKAKINLQLPEVRRGRIFPHTKTIPSLNQLQASSAAFEFDPETTKPQWTNYNAILMSVSLRPSHSVGANVKASSEAVNIKTTAPT